MKEIKKSKNKQKIKLNKINKILFNILLVIIMINVILFLISIASKSIHNFMWLNIINPFKGFVYNFLDSFPFVSKKFYFISYIIFLIFFVILLVLENSNKIKYDKKLKYYNYVSPFLLVSILFLIPMFSIFYSYNNPKINYEYFSENVDKSYTKDDLVKLTNYMKKNLIELSDDFKRVNGKIINNDDLIDLAAKDLINISDKYKFLKGQYPNKIIDLSTSLNEKEFEVYGVTNLYSVSVNKSLDDVKLINTITHEFCHTKGIVRESETEFCSFIAGINSNSKLSNYSAYYTAFTRLTFALSSVDYNLNEDILEEYSNLCLNRNYEEVCYFYPKEIDYYMDGTDYFQLSTYRLRNYIGYEDELIQFLETIDKEYHLTIEYNEEEILIEDIYNLINESNINQLFIIIDFDKKDFDKLSNALKENQKYFKIIYQIDEDYDYADYLEGEEALNYYLSPFNKNDLMLLFTFNFSEEYDYERVSRLLLEYYDNIL